MTQVYNLYIEKCNSLNITPSNMYIIVHVYKNYFIKDITKSWV